LNVDAGRLLKRFTICKVVDHRWVKTAYPDSGGSGHFLRCQRCGKENHVDVSSVRANSIGGA
jgi:hypothetical protein